RVVEQCYPVRSRERFLRLENPFYFFINFSFSTITTEKEEKRRFPSISFLPFLVLIFLWLFRT
ncbi:hypothetical protein, partial [Priestia megaterium]|uniref:hypothetical protein n=1 Tax=Priestia megaterium TaxID=1404 RepID=UPI002FFDE4D4